MKSVVALAAALNAAIAFGFQREQVDPRTRTYVYPERIAWASDGLKAEELLLPRHGQVPEAGWGQLHPPSGCRLANDVRHQAVVVDFGREIHGGVQLAFAAWLIEHVLGIRPVDVGCKTVMVRPFLGDLEWAEGAMALPDGQRVCVRVEKSVAGEMKVKVDAPDGVRIVR